MHREVGPAMASTIGEILPRLQAGAAAFAAADAGDRARLATDTARAVARAATAWVDATVTLKAGSSDTPPAEVVAEETTTGPIATLRLLLITARACRDVAAHGVPRSAAPPRELHQAGRADASLIGIDVLPEPWIADRAMSAGFQATVRCGNPGGIEAFMRSWREECRDRPRRGGVALVLGAGNVTGLAAADCISQTFEHGRASLLKLHPLHAHLATVLAAALEPLVTAGLLAIVTGGTEAAAEAIGSPLVTHVHLTGGQAAFDAIVWGPGPRSAEARPRLSTPITCELGGVTPWIMVPGRYTPAELASQADLVAASILNNTSFNCIATKCVVTCRSWDQRDEFLALVARRLAATPPRPAWYPGAIAAWETLTGQPAPADGTLPWTFRTGLDPEAEPRWLEREWFVPVASEVPLDAADIEAFGTRVTTLTRRLPGTLAASVTMPGSLAAADARRVELLIEHLEYGTVAINMWSAIGFAYASVPWGGFPGGTLAEPRSGIGWVHDPLCLPLVHNSIVRGPLLAKRTPAWVPWHPHGATLARGVVDVYASLADGGSGLWSLVKMLPRVFAG